MLQQPRVPPTGQRQAIEIQIKWREVLEQKQALLRIMNKTTGHSLEKLDHASLCSPISYPAVSQHLLSALFCACALSSTSSHSSMLLPSFQRQSSLGDLCKPLGRLHAASAFIERCLPALAAGHAAATLHAAQGRH